MNGDRNPRPTTGLVRGLGFVSMAALFTGNTIGSGIYVLPASLADAAGPLALGAWLIVAVAYVPLIAAYGDLASAYPVSGGFQVYTQRAFGDLTGTVVSFLYWLACVVGNAAFLTAFVAYAQVLVPSLAPAWASFAAAQFLLWGLVVLNVAGVRFGGAAQVATTVLKVLPLLVLVVVLVPHASFASLAPLAPKGWGALLPAVGLVAWAFTGCESVIVPAEEVRGEPSLVGRAARAGFVFTVLVYLGLSAAVALAIPSAEIAGSASPLATAARRFMGPWGETFVTLGALVSVAGILNGFLLVVGRIPFAAARQGFAPAWFGGIHPRFGTPARAIAVSAAFTSALVLLYFSGTLLEAYNFIALAATATALIAVAAACAALGVLARREPERFTVAQRRRAPVVASAGIAVCALMFAGAGGLVMGLSCLVCGVPVLYHLAWQRVRRQAGANEAS